MESIKNRLLSNQSSAEYYETRGDTAKRDYYKNRANDDVVMLANMNGIDDESEIMNNITISAIKKFWNKPLELLNKLPYIKREFISKYSDNITTAIKQQYGSNPSLGQIMDVINSMYKTSQESKTTQMKENKAFDDKVAKEIVEKDLKVKALELINKYLAGDDIDPDDLESAKKLLNSKEKIRLNEQLNKQSQFGKQMQLRSKQEQGLDIIPSELAELDDFDTNDPEYVSRSFGALGVRYVGRNWVIVVDGKNIIIDNPYELLAPMASIIERESNKGRKGKLIATFKNDIIEKIRTQEIGNELDTEQGVAERKDAGQEERRSNLKDELMLEYAGLEPDDREITPVHIERILQSLKSGERKIIMNDIRNKKFWKRMNPDEQLDSIVAFVDKKIEHGKRVRDALEERRNVASTRIARAIRSRNERKHQRDELEKRASTRIASVARSRIARNELKRLRTERTERLRAERTERSALETRSSTRIARAVRSHNEFKRQRIERIAIEERAERIRLAEASTKRKLARAEAKRTEAKRTEHAGPPPPPHA